MESLLLCTRLLLSVCFALAGLAKLGDRQGTRALLKDFGVPGVLTGVGAVILPVVELLAAALLIPAAAAWHGAVAVLGLLVLFIGAMAISLARGQRPECRCFGQLSAQPIGWKTIVRNTVLAGLAFFVLSQGQGNTGPGPIEWWNAASPLLAAIVVFSLLFAAVTTVMLTCLFHMLRQNGRLALRLEALEAKLGVERDVLPQMGLAVNTPAPQFSLPSLAGSVVTLSQILEQDDPIMLLFIEPGCGACDEILPDAARWQREHAERLRVVPISRGSVKENRAKAAEFGISGLLLQQDREVASAYMAEGSPSAVLVYKGRIASPVAPGGDYIRTLVSRALRPSPLKKGDPVPSRSLPGLDGGTFDLGAIKGRRTLLLFWNPGCSFCQKMKAALLEWERSRPASSPELLVISAGSVEANRAEGFLSRVLVDSAFETARVFDCTGTPSALLINEHGRIDSDVAVGAQAIMELAGPYAVGAAR